MALRLPVSMDTATRGRTIATHRRTDVTGLPELIARYHLTPPPGA
jgi:hypothetical protein